MRRKRRTNLAPAGLLLLAVLFRLGCGDLPIPPVAVRAAPAAAQNPAASPAAVTAAPEPAASAEPAAAAPDLQIQAAPSAEPPQPLAQHSAQLVTLAMTDDMVRHAADTLEIRNQTGYVVLLDELAATALTFDAEAEGPTVLLIHTHTTEAYTPEPGWEYDASDTMRTMDSAYNMVRIGDEVERVLTEAGLWVIHDEQINDYPSYNGSYGTALGRIEQWLARYPTIQMVLDLHRDAAVDAQGNYVSTSCTVDGASAAQLMLVCGTDYGGLQHPNWRGNLAFAIQLQWTLEQDNPGICRPLDLRCERFNQHATPLSLLVEVGSVGDTMAQALRAAEALGTSVATLLCGDH